MRIKGKISSWKDEKGFGFITPNGGGTQIFVHIKAFNSRKGTPSVNQIVTFTVSTDKQGRPCAEKVARVGELLSKDTKNKNTTLVFFVPLLFVFIVGISAFTNKVELLLFPFYLVVSLFTFPVC